MIDPIQSLSFSVHANPGVYAVLLGSGVSKAATIPTGWDITLDLVRKLARVCGENADDDPAEWYKKKYSVGPDYSALLDQLAGTPTERQQLLRVYLEANESEREDGIKQPTIAHKRIAEMAAAGFIRVIITTNFDRLMEMALAEVGVTPTVIGSVDQINGALPLIHTKCCLIKVHGDYVDTRIKNTPAELREYEPELDELLDRVFDQFGIIVCGWSADWDEALRSALTRCPSRRFGMYWAAVGNPSQLASDLIKHRGASLVQIDSADDFFGRLGDNVASLIEFSRPHPLSTQIAVASIKKFLSEDKYRIQLDDLVGEAVQRVKEGAADEKFITKGGPSPTVETFTGRVRSYEALTETLIAMAVQAGYWSKPGQYDVWIKSVAELGTVPRQSDGYKAWNGLARYPATLLLYALGIGAVERAQFQALGSLLASKVHLLNDSDKAAAQMLPAECLFEDEHGPQTLLAGRINKIAALSGHIHDLLRPNFHRLLPNDPRFTFVFDKLEVLMALGFAFHSDRDPQWYFAPRGCWAYRNSNCDRVLAEINSSIETEGDSSAYVQSGIFGHSAEQCLSQTLAFSNFRNSRNGRGY
jgi:hypothetical protein